MSAAVTRVRGKAGAGAFYIGMSLIGASIVLNIAYDRLSWSGAEVMPHFLTHLYETAGKNGVTVIFVALGLSVMLFGLALPKSAGERYAEEVAREEALPLVSASDPTPSDDSPDAPTTTPNGQIILRTQQYMRRKSGPSR